MTGTSDLTERNAEFVAQGFDADLTINPVYDVATGRVETVVPPALLSVD